MNCQFCQQECIEKIIHQTSLGPGASDFTCINCSTVVYTKFHQEAQCNKYIIYHDDHIATFYLTTNRFELYKVIEENDKLIWKFVVDLPFLPDINPTNFTVRIKTIAILL